jgi:DNA-directed RNA polymerase subunit RPC12/RpoP
MNREPYPYITCPECESQLLNPTIEDNMYHFICHECGCGVWLEKEESEEEE